MANWQYITMKSVIHFSYKICFTFIKENRTYDQVLGDMQKARR